MAQVLRHLPKFNDDNLIVGLDTSDDAAVYKINDDTGIILTMDFFTPVVDDPYKYGQVAAANSLSDVYAMGGRPLTAMNIVCFPNCLSVDILGQILKGGADKILEAGAVVAGGHSVEDNEPKYGLSVMGIVHPDKVVTNSNAKPGDVLILTKPLGIGILNTAIKADLVEKEIIEKAINIMSYLNKDACEAMQAVGVNSCTDITGFGLLGHALEMAEGSDVTIEIWSDYIPVVQESIELAKMGIIPGGAYRNQEHIGDKVVFINNVKQEIKDILFDPQTSGGLMISVSEGKAEELLSLLREKNKTPFSIIGKVKNKGKKPLEVI
ncbi:selenophosphate synthase [Lutispora thermophila DSM 19022]|uniref:Selenide, water dikinase n=1 Tax=Lutispora thermophila DSM 19022 TaxID=1122184 RepID=A0A1M6DAX8_9FIRM|nr:selenophosphate synthase [Lutispora thermophila DSM 19022]